MPVTPKTAISKSAAIDALGGNDKQAHVKEETVITKTYVEEKPDKTENSTNENQAANQNGAGNNSRTPFVYETQTAPTNRLADMFADMKEAQDNDGEVFVALVTRRQDLMTDKFRQPCMQATQFAPLQVTSDYFLQFIPILQRYNHNSGGRFDIVICDEYGQPLEIGLSNLVISDPLDEVPNPVKRESDVLSIMREMNEASDKRFAELLSAMNRPKEDDEFTKLAKQKLYRDILEPKESERKNFDPQEYAANLLAAPTMIAALTAQMQKAFEHVGGNSEKEKSGLLETLLTNEMVIDRASGIVENITNVLGSLAQSRLTPNSAVAQPPIYQQSPQGYPPLQPQPAPEQTNEIDMETKQIIIDLTSELESDRPLDDTNAVLKDIREKHESIYKQLIMVCKLMPFDTLTEQVESAVPDVFNKYYDANGDATELGNHVLNRLEQFYESMKTKEL